jgi:hypothetical protein
MLYAGRFGIVLLLVTAAFAAACDGDGGSGVTVAPGDGPTATPAAASGGEPSPTVAAGASPTSEQPPAAPVPDVDPSLEVLNLGEMNLSIGAGETYGFEPLDLAEGEAPPCAAFVFLFGWQVQDPYPPEGVVLTVTSTRMGGTETLGEEASGTATIGCGFVEVANGSDFPISVQVRYAIAQMTG